MGATRLAVVAVLALATLARAQALDVRGSWQANLGCGTVADATVFYQLEQDLVTGVVSTAPPAACGTIAFANQLLPIAACSTTPATVTGQVTGSAFALPDGGTFRSDSTVTPFGFLGCPVGRILIDTSVAGAIADDGAGRAVAISGTLTTSGGELRRADGTFCSVLSAATPDCTLEMRRNDVPVGSDVQVAPTSLLALAFDTVTSAGIVAAFEDTAVLGTFPTGFRVYQRGGAPLFWNVTTTATTAGPIGVCFTYPDADGDGVVDGFGGLPETHLAVVQLEDGRYVDRTASRDPLGNRVCGTTTDLAQLTFGTQHFVGPTTDQAIAARKLTIQSLSGGRSRLTFVAKDAGVPAPVAGGPDDPADGEPGGGIVELFTQHAGQGGRLMGFWTRSRRGDRWDHELPRPRAIGDDRATLAAGKTLRIQIQTSLVPLTAPLGRVALRFRVGSLRTCTLFDGPAIRRDQPGSFSASKAPAGTLPDCDDATLEAAVGGS